MGKGTCHGEEPSIEVRAIPKLSACQFGLPLSSIAIAYGITMKEVVEVPYPRAADGGRPSPLFTQRVEFLAEKLAAEAQNGVLVLRQAQHGDVVRLLSAICRAEEDLQRKRRDNSGMKFSPITLVLDGWDAPFLIESTSDPSHTKRRGQLQKIPIYMLPSLRENSTGAMQRAEQKRCQMISEVCEWAPISDEQAATLVSMFQRLANEQDVISEPVFCKALLEMGAITNAGILLANSTLLHHIFTYFDCSSAGYICLNDFVTGVVSLGATGNATSRFQFIHQVLLGADGFLRIENLKEFFDFFIALQEKILERDLSDLHHASQQWIETFFACCGHECLSEEALKVFLDGPNPGDYTTMPEPMAQSKLMVWRTFSEFCAWWDISREVVRVPEEETMSREVYFKGSLWEQNIMDPHDQTFRNINRQRTETIVKEDALLLAVLCGYTGSSCESFAHSFVGLSEVGFCQQMQELQCFAPFGTSKKHQIPRPTDPQVAREWVLFIQAAARLMNSSSHSDQQTAGMLAGVRGCRGCRAGPGGKGCSLM